MWEKIAYWLLGLSEAGAQHSAPTKAKLQSIHDTTAGMLGMECASGPESTADTVVSESFQARMQEAWRSYSETQQAVQKALPTPYGYIRDIWDDRVVWCAWDEDGERLYEAPYTIIDGVATVGEPKLVRPVTTYESAPIAEAAAQEPAAESAATEITGDVVPLIEKAVTADGAARIKIIAPGWGSSGFYSEAVLKRDGPGAFPSGTKTFWNHPTITEEAERPERDLRDLAGVTTSDARWEDDPVHGPGLYADTTVFEAYQQPVNDLAPHIGNSIRALGQARAGEAEGRQGPIVEKIIKGESIDYVTQAGAGGKIVSLFEAARPQHVITPQETNDMTEEEAKRLREAYDAMAIENGRLREADIIRQVERVVSATLAASDELLPMTRERLFKEAVKSPPITDGKLDEAKLTERTGDLIRNELAYLAGVSGGGVIRGMGGETPKELTEADMQTELASIFGATGLSESGARIAAKGRVA